MPKSKSKKARTETQTPKFRLAVGETKDCPVSLLRLDLNNPPADMQPPELLSHYEATSVSV